MSIDHTVTGQLETAVAVKYTACGLSHGKWKTQPQGVVPIGLTQIFEAINVGSSAQPPCGWCSFVAADGTKFTFEFQDNMAEDNYCGSSMDPVSGPWMLPTPIYPKSGMTFTVIYYIRQSNSGEFIDAPVFPDDLLAAPKCDLYSREEIVKYIDGRSCLYLKDVFAVNGLKPAAKIWCATNSLFLTPASKSILTRDLALTAAEELSKDALSETKGFENMLDANERISKGSLSKSDAQNLKQNIDEKYLAAKKRNNRRDIELIDTAAALLRFDLSAGWATAVASYLNVAEGEALAKRTDTILKLIEKRL